MPRSDSRPVERRSAERGEGAEAWSDDDRKRLLAIGGLVDKWNTRHGKPKEPAKKRHPLDELLGITEE